MRIRLKTRRRGSQEITQRAESALIEKCIGAFKEDGWVLHMSTQSLREKSLSLVKFASATQTDITL